MADKELRKMNRSELIEIIYALQQNERLLRAENETLKKRLDERILRLEKAGSIAEAALSLNNIFEDAQSAAAQYLDSVKEAGAGADQILGEAQQKADDILSSAQEQARQTEEKCHEECCAMREDAARDVKRMKEAFIRKVRKTMKQYPELAAHMREGSDT